VYMVCEQSLPMPMEKRVIHITKKVIGGLHLAGPESAKIVQPTVDFLARELRPSPTYILPMHCSGFQSKIALEKAFGEGCVPAGVGHKFEVMGDRVHDERLLPPSIGVQV